MSRINNSNSAYLKTYGDIIKKGEDGLGKILKKLNILLCGLGGALVPLLIAFFTQSWLGGILGMIALPHPAAMPIGFICGSIIAYFITKGIENATIQNEIRKRLKENLEKKILEMMNGTITVNKVADVMYTGSVQNKLSDKENIMLLEQIDRNEITAQDAMSTIKDKIISPLNHRLWRCDPKRLYRCRG